MKSRVSSSFCSVFGLHHQIRGLLSPECVTNFVCVVFLFFFAESSDLLLETRLMRAAPANQNSTVVFLRELQSQMLTFCGFLTASHFFQHCTVGRKDDRKRRKERENSGSRRADITRNVSPSISHRTLMRNKRHVTLSRCHGGGCGLETSTEPLVILDQLHAKNK